MFRIVQTIYLDDRRANKVRTGEGRIDADMVEDELAFDGGRGIEAHMTYEAVRAAMAKLPDEQRAVLTLVCVEGQSYKEAAAALDIPIGTVMSRLARARTALARMLGETGFIARFARRIEDFKRMSPRFDDETLMRYADGHCRAGRIARGRIGPGERTPASPRG